MVEETQQSCAGDSAWDRRLERGWRQIRWAGALLAYRMFPRLAAAALEIDAAGQRAEGIPQLFARDVQQIDPRLNDDLLELYGRSEQALRNHFGFFGRSQKFGAEINWEPPESPAWRRELHAGDYALDLALTYRLSGEEHYARHLRYLIAHWIASNPPVRGSGWQPHTLARRMRNWILSADLARADWERDAEFLSLLTHSLALQSAFLLRHTSLLPSRAASLDASRALLLAHRFFGGRRGFRAAALELLVEEPPLPGGKLGDASSLPEGSPAARLQRASVVMEWLLFDAQSPDADLLQETLRQALASLEAVLPPGGSLPLFGPGARACADELSDLAALAAVTLFGPASARWKALAGQFGILPYMLLGETGKAHFAGLSEASREAGPAVPQTRDCGEFYRLDTSDSSALLVTARVPSLSGDHQDFLSWELTTQGNRVVVDSGGFSPDEADYFPTAGAHNVLLVDGQISQPGKALQSVSAEHWKCGPDYVRLKLFDPGLRSQGLDHERAWFCLEGRGWVVLDQLAGRPAAQSPTRPGRRPQRLRGAGRAVPRRVSLLHFYPAFEILADDRRAIARSRACALTVFPLGQPPARLRASRGPAGEGEFPGWYSPEFGMRYPASVLAVEWESGPSPWVGGVLIVPGEEASFRMLGSSGNQVSFEWSGKQYTLEM